MVDVEMNVFCYRTVGVADGEMLAAKGRTLPSLDGRTNTWNESAVAAARLAETTWVRVSANMPAGLYDVHEATGNLAAPEWPDLSFQEILRLAFRDRFIHDVDHAVLRALRGEA